MSGRKQTKNLLLGVIGVAVFFGIIAWFRGESQVRQRPKGPVDAASEVMSVVEDIWIKTTSALEHPRGSTLEMVAAVEQAEFVSAMKKIRPRALKMRRIGPDAIEDPIAGWTNFGDVLLRTNFADDPRCLSGEDPIAITRPFRQYAEGPFVWFAIFIDRSAEKRISDTPPVQR